MQVAVGECGAGRAAVSDNDRDRLYRAHDAEPGDFVFDDAVAAVFPDMIQRSVPGYPAIVRMIGLLATRYAQPGSRLYDLGCSLGASTLALAEGAPRDCRVIGVDNAPAMLARARALTQDTRPDIEWCCADIRDVTCEDASIVVLNFTLQFLPAEHRLPLLTRLCAGLRPGGVLILSEKIAGVDETADALLVAMHHAFKRANGYSEMEIARKRTALENVLMPETLSVHRQRLREAGFARADTWFQCFNFASLVAAK
jgi:tRNA (cmo5U34)-methyltransferase